jgi:alanine-glyoxylate transaminase/serine-glyoxylate transaminase/serine-pyruvate transaminase
MDEVRDALSRLFRAPEGSTVLAVSGTGTAAMETCLANLVEAGTRMVVVTNGYFGERLAEIGQRLGGQVHRVAGEWGRAIDPATVSDAIASTSPQLVAVVHAETSTGVVNPVEAIAAGPRQRCVDPRGRGDFAGRYAGGRRRMGIDVQRQPEVPGAPSGTHRSFHAACVGTACVLPQLLFRSHSARRATGASAAIITRLRRRSSMRWRKRFPRSRTKDLEQRWERHRRHHELFASALAGIGLTLLPPEPEQLWTLHTVVVPQGVDEAAVRRDLREQYNIEIGAGMGPLAGRVWRIGLMGASSTPSAIAAFVSALSVLLKR